MRPRWHRWSRPVLALLLVMIALTGYGLARRGGASGQGPGAPPTSGPVDPTVAPGASGGQDGATPPTAPGSTGPGRQPPPGGTAGSTATTGADPTATTRETTTRPPRSKNWVVKWVLSLGPDAPTTPAIEIEPYLSLLERDCAGALQSADRVFGNQDDPRGAVYRGAANACLAAFQGQPQRWAPARRQLASPSPAAPTCAVPSSRRWSGWSRSSGCTTRTGPRVRGAGAAGVLQPGRDRLEPDHGAAGQEVRVVGTNLQCASGVRVEQKTRSEPADVIPDPGGGGASFTVPEGLRSRRGRGGRPGLHRRLADGPGGLHLRGRGLR